MRALLSGLAATFLLLTAYSFQPLHAQTIIRCGTMEADVDLRDRHPEIGSLDDFETWMSAEKDEYENSHLGHRAGTIYTIPVIFHVIHDGESVGTGANLSATLIQAQLDQLNDDYRKMGAGSNSHPDGADVEIEFCLAQLNESNSPLSEPGINRINRSSAGFSRPPYSQSYYESVIKPNTQWDPDDYLNIWISELSGGLLGYAQFPEAATLGGIGTGNGAANTDGVVIVYSSVGSVANPNPAGGSYNKGRTMTHEVGHWLGLRHIWGDGGCSADDYCGDTPASDAANYGCPSGHTSCGSTDMIQNYMDYTDDACMNIFTNDQRTRMRIVMGATGIGSPRRAILASSTKCGTGGGGGGGTISCGVTISSFPYTEGFESGTGDWTQASGDDFDWTRKSGSTPSSGTGPSSADEGSYYMYVESSNPNYPSKVTTLNGPCFDLSSATSASLTFNYHMYGASNMGDLDLQARIDGSSWTSVWSESGNQGNSWEDATVNLDAYLGETVQLRFVGTTGSTWKGDMAIDDLNLAAGSGGGGGGSACAADITSFPYAEGFESGTGDWSQVSGDDFDWARRSGGTPSSGTGPSAASEGTYYMYVESSNPNYPTKTTVLNGPCFDLTTASSATFDFDYHMYGASNMGSLDLEASTNDGASWTSVWSESGNQGNAWESASVDLASYIGGTVRLRYVGITGATWKGDMAVDNINLSTGGSSGGGSGCTDITLSITFDNYPEETSWEITDGSGAVIASGGTYKSEADGSTLNLSGCIANACYTLTMKDAASDGLCCGYGSGSYSLTEDASGTVLASGASFGASESTPFCLSGGSRIGDGTNRTEVSITDGQPFELISFYPNPATDVINIDYMVKGISELDVRVIDILGRTVSTEKWQIEDGENNISLDVSTLQQGTYLLVVEGEDIRESSRFTVVK